MDDSQYHYLDEERIKLWRELRKTQEQFAAMEYAVKGDEEGVQKCLVHLGLQVAKAYNRMMERDSDTVEIVKTISSKKDIVETAAEAVAASHKNVLEKESFVREQAERVESEMSKFDQGLQDVSNRFDVLKGKVEDVATAVDEAESSSADIASKQEEVGKKHEKILANYKEISKVHSLVFGYQKEDGSIVEGKKQELDNAYAELEQKIDASAKRVGDMEGEFKGKCDKIVEEAQSEISVLTKRIRDLLPDALTAGLSSAYCANKEAEETEHEEGLKLFKRAIKGMLLLALMPIGLNLWLWLFKDYTLLQLIEKLPREMLCIIPLYLPLFWLAIFANKRVNLSKRLIEEYKHKEAVSKTYEGLARQIAELDDEVASKELQARLLYNTVMLSEKNPGELIKNYNRPDNPLLDVLDHGSRFAEAMEKFSRVPGIGRICRIATSKRQKENELTAAVSQAVNAVKGGVDCVEGDANG